MKYIKKTTNILISKKIIKLNKELKYTKDTTTKNNKINNIISTIERENVWFVWKSQVKKDTYKKIKRD